MQIIDVQATDVIQSMTNNDLYLYKRKNSNAAFRDLVAYDTYMQNSHKTGTVFVSRSKEDLTEGKGFIVTSYEALNTKYRKLTHWTPNIFRGGRYYDFQRQYIKGHEKENLKQINVIGFDIDTKNVDLYALFLACDELNLPRPNVLLETPRGYQGFFILDTPFFIHKQGDYKALRVADRIASNILEALSHYVPVDSNCNQFGFYRIPNDENIIYFDDEKIETNSLIEWSKAYEHESKKKKFHVIYGGKHSSECQYVASDWYRALLQTKSIRSGEYAASRNNALLTLALANYADNIPFETAYDVLDQWNSALDHPLPLKEFERTLKSAYSGKYKGVQREYVESLLENWTNGNATFTGQSGWYKFAKPREDRERSHYKEWEQDIVSYLEANTSAEQPFYSCSLRGLAKQLEMPVSTLKEVLKKSTYLYKKTKGKGRAAKTILATKSMLFNHLLVIRKKDDKTVQMIFTELFCGTQKSYNGQEKYKGFSTETIRDTS
ncbi:primase C-terminal domain-containing protein [Virgibacillus salexigens]|uniref:primase C-terminal domain-containing protein n=1 Tax=Virgibacillus massiliensis TaxID=1462526 RepID=UPI00136E0DA3|nr:plasmid replication protein [Virgibacillus massiliensis]